MSDTQPTDLLAYFAANAPADIPDWFQPDMEHLQPPPRPADADSASWSSRVPQHVLDWNARALDLKTQREEYRYFAWRWYYAEKMKAAKPTQEAVLPAMRIPT